MKCKHCAETIYWAYDKPFRTQDDAMAHARDCRLQEQEREKAKEAARARQEVVVKEQLHQFEQRRLEITARRQRRVNWLKSQAQRMKGLVSWLWQTAAVRLLRRISFWIVFVPLVVIWCVVNTAALVDFYLRDEIQRQQQLVLHYYSPLSVMSWVRAPLSAEAATSLAQYEGSLSLYGPTTLSPEVAEALAQHKGRLYLDGLTTLSDEAAQALAKHKRDLSFRSLKMLSDEAAKALAQHDGDLRLDGLTTLSDEAVKTLRAKPKIRLPGKFL